MKKRKPKPRRFITLQVISQCIDLRDHGFTWRECGEMLGEKMDSLRGALIRAGVPMVGTKEGQENGCPKKATPELIAKARQLRAEGMCWKLIERTIGVNWKTIAWRIYAENKAARDGQ